MNNSNSFKIIWTAQARRNLGDIRNFLIRTGATKTQANKVAKAIRQEVKTLSPETLEMGAKLAEEHLDLKLEYRFLLSKQYKIVYRAEGSELAIIITVFDTRQDPEKLKIVETDD
jgi:plasmid stabilization system protein ParE